MRGEGRGEKVGGARQRGEACEGRLAIVLGFGLGMLGRGRRESEGMRARGFMVGVCFVWWSWWLWLEMCSVAWKGERESGWLVNGEW
jgi:hypothetical protein